MDFETWWKEESGWGSDEPLLSEGHLARDAWNAAIEQAANKVEEYFDEQEPWIIPQDIKDLSA